MTIRKMTIHDYETVFSLWRNISGIGLRSLDDSRSGIEKFLQRNPGTNFVAEADGVIIGVILSGHDGRRGYIYHAAVHPFHQNQGIGRLLVRRALTALGREGINRVGLVAYQNNQEGNAFWKAMGFEERTDLAYWNKSINPENE